MRCNLWARFLTRKGALKMPRRNGPASGGRGHMKGRQEFVRRRSFGGIPPMRHADISINSRVSRDVGDIFSMNQTSRRAQDISRPDKTSIVAVVDKDTCTGCGACLDACPADAIMVGTIARIDTQLCQGCAACVDRCPFGAIAMGYTS